MPDGALIVSGMAFLGQGPVRFRRSRGVACRRRATFQENHAVPGVPAPRSAVPRQPRRGRRQSRRRLRAGRVQRTRARPGSGCFASTNITSIMPCLRTNPQCQASWRSAGRKRSRGRRGRSAGRRARHGAPRPGTEEPTPAAGPRLIRVRLHRHLLIGRFSAFLFSAFIAIALQTTARDPGRRAGDRVLSMTKPATIMLRAAPLCLPRARDAASVMCRRTTRSGANVVASEAMIMRSRSTITPNHLSRSHRCRT